MNSRRKHNTHSRVLPRGENPFEMTSTKYGIHAYPPKFSDPQFIKRLMADYGQRSMPRPGKGLERTETSDVDRFQFWPDAIAMGSLKGRQFTQVSSHSAITPSLTYLGIRSGLYQRL